MTLTRYAVVLAAALAVLGHSAQANTACAPFSDAAEELPLVFVDRADPFAARVTSALEEKLLLEQLAEAEAPPLSKVYCAVGMFEMVVRFVQPQLDDSIAAIVTEARYAWDAAQDPAGWALAGMRRHHLCARGPAAFAPTCN